MERFEVAFFKPYPFEIGQKIRIAEGPRKGDWEVVGTTERKVTLRCPLSQREFEWNRFCYSTDVRSGVIWPEKDESQ